VGAIVETYHTAGGTNKAFVVAARVTVRSEIQVVAGAAKGFFPSQLGAG
jgi:hypothetical protein